MPRNPTVSLTLSQLTSLGDVVRACSRNAKARYYPEGTDTFKPMEFTLRAITHEGGNFWFDGDGDVRDAYVWTSGFSEHWYKLADLADAHLNAYATKDASAPMLVIEDA